MIYHFRFKIEDGKDTIEKDLYLTAENERDFYRRASSQYRLDIRDIEILEEIDDENIDISTDTFKNKKKVNVEKEPEVDSYKEQAKEMLSGDIRGLNQEKIQSRIDSGWNYLELVDLELSLPEYLKKFKTVKLYYLKGGPRKNKKYFILYK